MYVYSWLHVPKLVNVLGRSLNPLIFLAVFFVLVKQNFFFIYIRF